MNPDQYNYDEKSNIGLDGCPSVVNDVINNVLNDFDNKSVISNCESSSEYLNRSTNSHFFNDLHNFQNSNLKNIQQQNNYQYQNYSNQRFNNRNMMTMPLLRSNNYENNYSNNQFIPQTSNLNINATPFLPKNNKKHIEIESHSESGSTNYDIPCNIIKSSENQNKLIFSNSFNNNNMSNKQIPMISSLTTSENFNCFDNLNNQKNQNFPSNSMPLPMFSYVGNIN
jgi:hypothetical protein